MRRHHLGYGAILGAIAMAMALAPRAKAEVVERVVAVVNDEAIFLSELRRRASPFLERTLGLPTQEARIAAIQQLYSELLERMVQEELFIQAADRMQVSVTRAEVERAIGNVQRQAGLSDADFWAAVSARNTSAALWPSHVSTCQPEASKRLLLSVVSESSRAPSMVMLLSS